MEPEIVPIRFYKGINSYWRSRRYQKIDASSSPPTGKKPKKATSRLGSGSGRWFLRLRRRISLSRFRIRIPSPLKILTRLRDAYVDWMLSAAGKAPALSEPATWTKRIPKSRPAKTRTSEIERRLMFEIYNSLVVAGEIKLKQA
ncbi:hypothetical protein ZIOFF_011370 [Zingiber officinale]|uniref:Uncharacterized protein n=1 Tax=Zingiber officinale TaxID=94328 RepID=A0A8J5M107_ZINOF|nr:hypothetical protein ZIOFF_011370 [Zingiber officinale]